MAPPAQALRDLTRRLPPGPAHLRRTAGIENATRRLLLAGVMPLWLGAGLADWYLHRRTRIEDTARRGYRPCTRWCSPRPGCPSCSGCSAR